MSPSTVELCSEELEVPALGRPVFLGQLYSASSGRLINAQLFDSEVLKKEQIVNTSSNSIKYADISAISDRANALDIPPGFSVGILGGLVELKGSARYLHATRSNFASREVSIICSVRKCWRRLDVGVNENIPMGAYERAVKRGASHVITGIALGGTLVAHFVQKTSTAKSRDRKRFDLSATAIQAMANIFSAGGKVALDHDKQLTDVTENCHFECYGDYSVPEQQNPTTIGDIFELVEKWPTLIGEGVTIQFTAQPIDQFVDGSVPARVLYELEAEHLSTILGLYEEIYRLAARRASIQAALDSGSEILSACCPTFTIDCQKRKRSADSVLEHSRGALSRYLVSYREGKEEMVGKSTGKFLSRIMEGLDSLVPDCEQDESALGLLENIRALSIDHNAPLATVGELRTLMTHADQSALGVILIPPYPAGSLNSVINTYIDLVTDIQRWRAEEDKRDRRGSNGRAKETIFASFYCDSARCAELLELDGENGALQRALGHVQGKDPCFVHYAVLEDASTTPGRLDWSLVNEDGWGVLRGEGASYRYVGQIRTGKRHGRGMIIYQNGSIYTGDWWNDKRHGEGVVEDKYRGKKTCGVFINDQYREDGIIVDVTIVAQHVPVAAAKIPLRRWDSATTHVRTIGTMLEWTDADVHRLSVKCAADFEQSLELTVAGRLIRTIGYGQGDKYMMQYSRSCWPFDKGVELWAERC
ncbi:hypothetical protein V5O48_010363 [Marasmius crinis-equi]|uniref:SNTX MACPF/CDC-like domain-containing protein n=1 Tax=Marasmius crinis-equi TaxID=585013 RepID=A0ABR3F8L7_9AGAR